MTMSEIAGRRWEVRLVVREGVSGGKGGYAPAACAVAPVADAANRSARVFIAGDQSDQNKAEANVEAN